jgi:hypothetical protein
VMSSGRPAGARIRRIQEAHPLSGPKAHLKAHP